MGFDGRGGGKRGLYVTFLTPELQPHALGSRKLLRTASSCPRGAKLEHCTLLEIATHAVIDITCLILSRMTPFGRSSCPCPSPTTLTGSHSVDQFLPAFSRPSKLSTAWVVTLKPRWSPDTSRSLASFLHFCAFRTLGLQRRPWW